MFYAINFKRGDQFGWKLKAKHVILDNFCTFGVCDFTYSNLIFVSSGHFPTNHQPNTADPYPRQLAYVEADILRPYPLTDTTGDVAGDST